MKRRLFLLCSFLIISVVSYGQLNDLIIVEYVDWNSGSGWGIKVCNYSGSTINLANYKVQVYNNSSTTPSLDEILSGNINDGACIVIGNPSYNSQSCSVDFLTVSDHGVNGDDAIALVDLSGNYVDMMNGVGYGTRQKIGSDNNALKFNRVLRSQTNCNRYTNLSGTGANSWPTNNTNPVPGWSVFSVSCLSSGTFVFSQPTKSQNVSICHGDSLLIGGVWRKNSGNYQESVTASSGCDTLLFTQLTVLNPIKNAFAATICSGESYSFNGNLYTAPGIYRDTLLANNGCDSVLELNLTQEPLKQLYDTVKICFGDVYFFNGNSLSISGDYKDTLVYSHSCDTILNLNLVIRPENKSNVNLSICDGDSAFLANAFQSVPGIYYDTLQDMFNCDSIIITNLSVLPQLKASRAYSICRGDSILINGQMIYSDTNFIYRKSKISSCDSLIDVSVIVEPLMLEFTYEIEGLDVEFMNSSFNGTSYKWSFGDGNESVAINPNNSYPSEGVFPVKLIGTNSIGCTDSITKQIDIQLKDQYSLFVPNVFSPNGDRVNDNFKVVYNGDFDFEIHIFNRWGEEVFNSDDLDFEWNGKINGQVASQTRFYYFIKGDFKREGYITLIQ